MRRDFFSFEKSPILDYRTLDKQGVFVGCEIKTKYDEDRIRIKDKFNPVRFKHLNRNLYGILLEPTREHSNLLDILKEYYNIDLFCYNKTLNAFNLTCDDNFLYLEYGLYPVDAKYIFKYQPKFSYKEFFLEIENVPEYQKIKSVNMLFVTPHL